MLNHRPFSINLIHRVADCIIDGTIGMTTLVCHRDHTIQSIIEDMLRRTGGILLNHRASQSIELSGC